MCRYSLHCSVCAATSLCAAWAPPAQAANLVCQFVTAVLNTTVNRRVTFGIRELRTQGRHQVRDSSIRCRVVVASAALAVRTRLPTPAHRDRSNRADRRDPYWQQSDSSSTGSGCSGPGNVVVAAAGRQSARQTPGLAPRPAPSSSVSCRGKEREGFGPTPPRLRTF